MKTIHKNVRFAKTIHFVSLAFKVTFASTLAACLSGTALAQSGSHYPATRFIGVRPAGMGNAFTAVADDQNALYYNPAGLAKIPTWSMEILSPLLGINQNIKDNTTEVRDILSSSKGGSGSQASVVENIGPIIESVSGENHYLRAGLAPYLVIPELNAGMGLYTQIESELVPHGQAVPSIVDFSFQGDTDLRFGFAHSFFGKKLAVGGTLAYRERVQILTDAQNGFSLFKLTEITKSDDARSAFVRDSLRAGYAVGLDTGLLFTPVEVWSPTLGVSILNMGDTTFRRGGLTGNKVSSSVNGNTGVPTSVPQSLNFGLSVTPTSGNWLSRVAFDYADANLPIPASQKPSLGVEGGWRGKYVSALAQGGVSEGYLSGGFEVRLLIVNIRYATYVTERGYFPTQSPDRRHLLQLKVLL
jgi:hypothetical protein